MTKHAITWNERKYGSAAGVPQLPLASTHLPLASSIIASIISPDQPSPVMHWKRSSADEPMLTKLRSDV